MTKPNKAIQRNQPGIA